LFVWVELGRAVAIRLGDRAAGKTARRASTTHDFKGDRPSISPRPRFGGPGAESEACVERVSRTAKIAAVVTLFASAFLMVSILSFDPADPPGHSVYPPNAKVHNLCGTAGAYAAWSILAAIGDGAYAMLLFLIFGSFLWVSRISTEDKIFRIIGAALLVLDVTVAAAMIASGARMPESNGGLFGLGIWQYLEPRMGAFGTVLLMIPVGLVGLILLTDTFLVTVPLMILRWLRDRASGPAKGLATASLATAGAAIGRLAGLPAGGGTDVAEPEENEAPPPIVRKQRRPADPDTRAGPPKRDAGDADTGGAEEAKRGRRADHAGAGEPGEDAAPASPPSPPRQVIIRHARPPAKPQDEEDADFAFTPLPSTPRNQEYQLPPLDLLQDPQYAEGRDQEAHIRELAEVLTRTLAEFGVNATVVAIETGPVVTQYELALAPGIKVGKVISLSEDIAIGLKAPSVRIVAPLPGKDTIGVEVPNTARQVVCLKEIVLAAKDAPERMGLPLFLGKDSTGEPLVRDLASMPHLLIAGTTGSGKSVCLNTIIMSLLLTRTPDDLRLVLIDPKMVELSVFNKLPHLLCPVVNDMRKAEAILGWLVDRMEERYRVLSQAGVRNIAGYNRLTREELIARFQPQGPEQEAKLLFHMPHICVIVDELADLMMVAAKEVEMHVTRLSQKSRAVGIHLVMATQRPSVDVLTGLIKSNLPIRISFQVATRIDSRTILDSMGAEKLLGQGDMIFMVPGINKFVRAQGAFVSDQDIQNVLDFVTAKAEPEYQRDLVQLKVEGDEEAGDDAEGLLAAGADDPMYNQSIEIVLEHQRGSVSLLQRRLGIGYGRAARLIDQMAEDGIVGDYKGSQAREVLLTLEQWQALKQQRRADEDADPKPKDPRPCDDEADLDT
jgi:S-DNA-T family DNA segregation ATPase FtsK/SpoIIIE